MFGHGVLRRKTLHDDTDSRGQQCLNYPEKIRRKNPFGWVKGCIGVRVRMCMFESGRNL